MHHELNLRTYAAFIIRYWSLIGVFTIAGAVVAALATRFLLTPIYEAQSTLVITGSSYRVSLEPRITSPAVSRPSDREYGAMADNAVVLAGVVEELAIHYLRSCARPRRWPRYAWSLLNVTPASSFWECATLMLA